MPKITEVDKGKGTTREREKFKPSDWKLVAGYVDDVLADRRRRRADRERAWKEVDRQIQMRPDIDFKMVPDGSGKPTMRVDPRKAWMPEIELPWQATALEILSADCRRMMFPDAGPWYQAHAEMTDDLLRALEGGAVGLSGDDLETPSKIDQRDLNQLVLATGNFWKNQYDFDGTYDATNVEALKYGTGVARWRLARKSILSMTARGVAKENKIIPVRVPRTIKGVYLDDTEHEVMHEGQMLGPLIIECKKQSLEDIIIAAKSGKTDPESFDGGWMPANVKGMKGDDNGQVEIIEAEGDFAVSRKTAGSLVLHGAIVTLAVGSKDDGTRDNRVVRFRWRKTQSSTYEITPYHVEDVDCAYASGILTKASPVQAAAVEAQNRLIEVGALQAQPPIGYDKSDVEFAANGGPGISPGALLGTNSPLTVHQIGNLNSCLQVFVAYQQQYSDLTGINAARVGAQTVSHTTAFAKDAELSRGTVRTVDYVRSAVKGGMTRGLYLEWELGREHFNKTTLYLESEKAFVDLTKPGLPKNVMFKAHGAAGPAEKQQDTQARFQAAQMVVQLEQLKISLGGQPSLDIQKLQEEFLKEGGWSDTESLFSSDGAAEPVTGGPGVQGDSGQPPGPAVAALQAIGQQ